MHGSDRRRSGRGCDDQGLPGGVTGSLIGGAGLPGGFGADDAELVGTPDAIGGGVPAVAVGGGVTAGGVSGGWGLEVTSHAQAQVKANPKSSLQAPTDENIMARCYRLRA